MRNVKLTLQYDGTNYAGWQSQKNALTIQDVLKKAIESIVCARVTVIGAGRTDSGVHATGQVANFRTTSKIPATKLRRAINTKLPSDILITSATDEGESFNSQLCARSKSYRYTILIGQSMPPLQRHYAAKCPYRLDLARMRQAAGYLVGRHDFTSFRTKDDREFGRSIRTVRRLVISRAGGLVTVTIEADGFLYNMVRNIVGTLIEVGRCRIAPDAIAGILRKKDKRSSGPTAPSRGLCLTRVRY